MIELYVRIHGLKEVAAKIGVKTPHLDGVGRRRIIPSLKVLAYFGLRKIQRDTYTSDVQGVV